ncbi:MAG: hypothetical protein PVJ92_01435, partial [Candidatus Dependentiae bacterium]
MKTNLTLLAAALLAVATPQTTLHAYSPQDSYVQPEREAPKTFQELYLAHTAAFNEKLREMEGADQLPSDIREELGEERFGHWSSTILQLGNPDLSEKLIDELIVVATSEKKKRALGATQVLALAAAFGKLSHKQAQRVFALCDEEEYGIRQGASWALFHYFIHHLPTDEQFDAL